MLIKNRFYKDILVIEVNGPLDHFTNVEFKKNLEELLEQHNLTKVIFDMEYCTKLRSAGNGSLVGFARKIKRNNGKMGIAALAGQPKEVAELLNIKRFARVFETLEEGLTQFSRE